MGSTVSKTCDALKRYGFSIKESENLLRPQNPKFDRVCRDEFQKAAQDQQNKLGKECVWTADDIQIMYNRLVQLGMWSKERGIQALFTTTKLSSHSYNYNSGNVEIYIPQCRFQSRIYLEYVLDHEAGHHRDHKLLDSLFPNLKKWRLEKQRNDTELINRYCDVLLHQVPEGKRQYVQDTLLNELFLVPRLSRMKPAERGKRLPIIEQTLAEILRYGEEIYDDRLKQLVFEEDFDDLFKKPPPQITPAQKQATLIQQKSEKAVWYLFRVLSAAQLEEAGAMENFKKQPYVDQDILNSLDRRHIDLFRLLIRAASRYFPTIGKHSA